LRAFLFIASPSEASTLAMLCIDLDHFKAITIVMATWPAPTCCAPSASA